MMAAHKKKVEAFLNPYLPKTQLIKILNFLGSFKLYGRLLVNLKTGDSRKTFLPENDFKICFTKLLMSFLVFQTFKLFLLKNSLWRNILIQLKIKVTLWSPLFLHFAQNSPEQKRVLINLIFLILGLQKMKNALMLPTNIYFFSFLSSHYVFLNYVKLFSFFYK